MTGLVNWITGASQTQKNAENATNAAQNNMKDAIAAQQQFLQQQQAASLQRLQDYLSKNQNPAKGWGNVTGPVNQNPASIGGGVLGMNGMPLNQQAGGGGQPSAAMNPQMIQALIAMLQKAHGAAPPPQPGTGGKAPVQPVQPPAPPQRGRPGGFGWHGPNGHMEVEPN